MVTKLSRLHLLSALILAVCLFPLVGCDLAQQRSVTELTPEEAEAQAISLYVDAMMLNELSEHEQALTKLNSSIELDPDSAMAYSLKGDILQQMERYEDSAAAYENATTFDPWSVKDFFNLGKVRQVLQQWTQAAQAYVTAVQLDPKHYEANLGAATSFYQLKEFDNALTYAEQAKVLQPDEAAPEHLMGDVFEAQKDHLQAIESYRRALELEGNTPELMLSLARAYLRASHYSSAIELLTDLTAMQPENGMAFQYLGFAQLKLKETRNAVENYRKAVEVNPDDWMARKAYGVALMLLSAQENNDQRLKAQALEQWHISLQIKPDQPKLQELIERNSN